MEHNFKVHKKVSQSIANRNSDYESTFVSILFERVTSRVRKAYNFSISMKCNGVLCMFNVPIQPLFGVLYMPSIMFFNSVRRSNQVYHNNGQS